MSSRLTRIAGIALVVAMLATTGLASMAYAASPTADPENLPPVGGAGDVPPGPSGDGLDNPGAGWFARGDFLMSRNDVKATIAEALGMTVEELQEAMEEQTIAEIARDKSVHVADIELAFQSARQDTLQTAVEDGTLTQAQADLLTEKLGEMPTWSDRYDRMFADGEMSLDTALTIARTLGMTVEDLEAALEQNTFFEIAKAQNVAIADVQSALEKVARTERIAAMGEKLQQAVEDGELTQEQADLMGALFALRSDDFGHGSMGMGPLGSGERPAMPGFGPHAMPKRPGTDRNERPQFGSRAMSGGRASDESGAPRFGSRNMPGGRGADRNDHPQFGFRNLPGPGGGDKSDWKQFDFRNMPGGRDNDGTDRPQGPADRSGGQRFGPPRGLTGPSADEPGTSRGQMRPAWPFFGAGPGVSE